GEAGAAALAGAQMKQTAKRIANCRWQMGQSNYGLSPWVKAIVIVLPFAISHLPFAIPSAVCAPVTSAPALGGGKSVTPDEMEFQIRGHFKGRLLVKKIVAPVTMNLEKLQDFPEDPSQKILLDPLPILQSAEFNARREVKGHAIFTPWI